MRDRIGRRRHRPLIGGVAALLLTASVLTPTLTASADSAPGVGVTPTVTTDVLPTAQIDGVAWAQAIVGSTVYVGGQFSSVRPAGAAPGVSTAPRGNLLSYRLETGIATAWAPKVTGVVKTIAPSPDGTRVYVGGTFTSVNGQPRSRIAVFDGVTGALLPWAPVVNGTVNDIVVSGDTVWVVGAFSSIAGVARMRLGAIDASTGALRSLQASLPGGNGVSSIVLDPTGTKIVVAGSFTSVNGSTNPGRGMAALDARTGALLPWKVNALVRNAGVNSGQTSLDSDADSVYGTAFDYGSNTAEDGFEGSFRASWTDGSLVWLDDCAGDDYSVAVGGGAVYTASHNHACSSLGGFADRSPKQFRHALAFSKAWGGAVLVPGTGTKRSYAGRPAATLLHWFPEWTVGTYTGKSQAVWSVDATDRWVVYGGEFPALNGTAQQGLARFAVSEVAPDRDGPQAAGDAFSVDVQPTTGAMRVSWIANVDRDNATLRYDLLREDQGTTPVWSGTLVSSFWNRPAMSIEDREVVAGATYRYRIRASDAWQNAATGEWRSATMPVAQPPSHVVLAQDDFDRTDTSGWGTADLGGRWSSSGNAALMSVDGAHGVMQVAPGSSQRSMLASVSSSSSRVTATFSIDEVVDGQYITVVGRQVGGSAYSLRLRTEASGASKMYLLRDEVAIGAAVTSPVPFVAGVTYSAALETVGLGTTSLSAKVWRTDESEPSAWVATRTDSTVALQAPGSVGVTSWVPSSASVRGAVTLRFDSIRVVDPAL